MYPIAVLAGGMATRLFPLTQEIPKSMINISGKPFIHWQLKLLSESGLKKIVLCLGVKSQLIEEYVGDGSQYGLEIRYSFDGESPLGTAGALAKALPLLGETFGVLYGDSYLEINYKSIMEFYSVQEKAGLMTIFNNTNQFDASNVELKEGLIIQYSKSNLSNRMQHIDYGFSILGRKSFRELPQNTNVDLTEVIGGLVSKGELLGYEVENRFFEIGSFQGIEDLRSYLEGNNE